jgi:hypothetical protein
LNKIDKIIEICGGVLQHFGEDEEKPETSGLIDLLRDEKRFAWGLNLEDDG